MRRRVGTVVLVLFGIALSGASGAQSRPATVVSASAPNELDRKVAELAAGEATLQRELDALGPAIDVTHRRMLARGRAYYRHVRAGLLPIGGGFDALVDHAARVERTRQALERDVATESQLMTRSAEVADEISRIRVERAPLEVHREAMLRARTALVEAEERRVAFSRAFESSTRPPDYMAVYGAELGPADADTRMGFLGRKGRLPFPITGRAEVRRVRRAGGPGLELGAASGSAVRSVAAGRAVFVDRYEDYGMTVLLDHGDGYFSLYGDLGGADVVVGDKVASGARIGSVGAGASLTGSVYFELRKSGETLDPAPWLGL